MRKPRLLPLLLLGSAALIGLALAWRFTPLAEFLKPERFAQHLEAIDQRGWAPFAFIGFYVVGSMVLFPVTVMSAVTATLFVPLKAVSISFTGIMLSSALSHWIGARFFRKGRSRVLGKTKEWLKEALADKSILTVAAVRLIPIAPFTLVNLAAGALGVRFRDFILGTALGLLPGMIAVCFFGRQVRQFWKNPGSEEALWVAGVGLLWIAMSVSLQYWVSHRRKRRK